MTDRLRAAAQAALEALTPLANAQFPDEREVLSDADVSAAYAAIEQLRAALAEQEVEPCHVFSVTVSGNVHEWEPTTAAFALQDGKHALYTAPPRREWRGLTDEEIDRVTDAQWARGNNKPIYAAHRAYARAVEAALRERNQ